MVLISDACLPTPVPLYPVPEPFSSLLVTAGVRRCAQLLLTRAAFVSCHRRARLHCLRGECSEGMCGF